MRVLMTQYKNNEFMFVNESCIDSDCLNGDYDKCNRNHQIIKRSSNTSTNVSTDESTNELQEDKTEVNYEPKWEFALNFKIDSSINLDKSVDEIVEISDCEDNFGGLVPDIGNDSYDSEYESKIIDLRQFVRKYDFRSYFSTDETITELDIPNHEADLFDQKLRNIISNDRSFGDRGYYLEDLDCLNLSEEFNDKIVDGMLEIVQNKSLATGNAVLAIPCAWYYMYTVGYIPYVILLQKF